MKPYVRPVIAVVCLLVAGSAHAATADASGEIVASVPFEFAIGDTELPRDVYRVSRASGHSDVFLLTSPRRSIFLIAQRDRTHDGAETPTLVFHRYGDRYFLRAIQFSGRDAITLRRSRGERDAADARIAGSTAPMEVVEIAGRPR